MSPPTGTNLAEQRRLARLLHDTIEAAAPLDVRERLRIRLRELGTNVLDEVKQFRQLQKACDESLRLSLALDDAGFGRIDQMDHVRVTPEVGRVVQIFNRMVEEFWEEDVKIHRRPVRYTADDPAVDE